MSPKARIKCLARGCEFEITGEIPDYEEKIDITDYNTRQKLRLHHKDTQKGEQGHPDYEAIYLENFRMAKIFVTTGGSGYYHVLPPDQE